MSELPLAIFRSLRDILGAPSSVSPLVGNGLSQASLWKWECPLASFVVKQHPSHRSSERTAAVHRFRGEMRRRGVACISVPETWKLESARFPISRSAPTIFHFQHSDWEYMRWMPGRPVTQIDAISHRQLEQAMQTLALLHAKSIQWDVRISKSIGIENRSNSLKQLHHEWTGRLVSTYIQRPQAELVEPFVRFARHWSPTLDRFLGPLRTIEAASAWISRDLHRDHVLFQEDILSGLIDLDAADVDWPLFDLVRFLGSTISLENVERWSQALDCYEHFLSNRIESAIFPIGWRAWLRPLCTVSLLLSGLYWCEQWYQNPEYEITPELQTRLAEILQQLASWSRSSHPDFGSA